MVVSVYSMILGIVDNEQKGKTLSDIVLSIEYLLIKVKLIVCMTGFETILFKIIHQFLHWGSPIIIELK